jgi:hypothetical protein
MFWRKKRPAAKAAEEAPAAPPPPLKEAVRQARIESAEHTGVVVDLRDAEVARLEIVNEGLNPVFAEIPPEVEMFDRGISKGDVPRLWIDAIAYVVMGRDKRTYRFVQETRFGRKLLLESPHSGEIVAAVTRYIAGRLIERERALAGEIDYSGRDSDLLRRRRRRQAWRATRAFIYGLIVGVAALFITAWLLGS